MRFTKQTDFKYAEGNNLIGFAIMSMLKCLSLVLGITVCIFNEAAYLTVTAQEVPSSCSEIFRYKSSTNGSSFAILPFIANSQELKLEFYVEQPIEDKNDIGILELYTNAVLNTKDVRYFGPLQFALTFPKWFTNTSLSISSMRLNGNLICNSNVPHGSNTHFTIEVQKKYTEMGKSGNTPTIPPLEYEECGKKQTQHLLENIYEVTIEEYPWLVVIYQKRGTSNRFICSGTLISRKHILTAAECVIRQSPDKLTVVLGRTVIDDLLSPGIIRNVNRIETHQDYVDLQADADLAILFLNKEVTFSKTVRAACIWPAETSINSIVGRRGDVLGWGLTAERHLTGSLLRVFLPVVSEEDCLTSNPMYFKHTSNRTFCAGSRDGSGPCDGDSGSGIYFEYNNATFIRGVLSLARIIEGKCDLSSYVIYTDVAKHYNWIQKNLHDISIPNPKELELFSNYEPL